jgi:hypothetical protein
MHKPHCAETGSQSEVRWQPSFCPPRLLERRPKALSRCLVERDKPHTSALVAFARKLLVFANADLRPH